jgi:hypothetical protein
MIHYSKKTYRIIHILLLSLFGLSFPSIAQEKLGIANSNYSSTNTIFLNPSSSSDSRTFIQQNLVGANAYFMTNGAYLPKFSVWSLADLQEPKFSTLRIRKFFYSNISIDGPTFVLSKGEIGVGFFIRGRAVVDIRNVPHELTRMILQPNADYLQQKTDVNLRNLKLSQMAWVEYGLNLSKMIRKRSDVLILAGVNVKYLTGINISYANLERFKASIQDTTINIEKLKGKIRINEPNWNSGQGLGIDAGITYKKTLDREDSYYAYYANSKKSDCKYIDYRYKFGLSLLDLGLIRFANKTAKGDIDGSAYIGNYQKDSVIQNNFKGSYQFNSPIWASLPTGLCAQADWNMDHHIYVNVTAIKSLTISRMVGVQRSNLISIAPRYERRQFEVALPLTFQRYLYPQLGLTFRVRSFVLGFDNVLPLIIKKNTYGVNVYFNLGISIFKNPACRPKKPKTPKAINKPNGSTFKAKQKTKAKEVDECPTDLNPTSSDKKNEEVEKQQQKEREKQEDEQKKHE